MQFPIKIDQSTMQLIKKWPVQFFLVISLIAVGYLFNWGISRVSKSDSSYDKQLAKKDSVINMLRADKNKTDSQLIDLYKELLYKNKIIDRIGIETDSTVRDKTEKPLKKILK